ncbi:MAG: hypothetical protein KZQ70_13080 [gamma proteobacterium symbiont of Lucinoma myriamae]|nr:hypothetical protein [gamma proteobacterium symbiont of Lucinoma myriamae]
MIEQKKSATKLDAIEAIKSIKGFVCSSQLNAIGHACRGEEKQFFFDKMVEVFETVKGMPVTYEQDGKGENAIAYLHYFKGNYDAYITEKDIEDEQLQARGWSKFYGNNFEDGYISLVELIDSQIELDLHFTPISIHELKKTFQ